MSQIEDGKYRARVANGSAQITKSSRGTPQAAVVFDLLDYPGQTITMFAALSDAALAYTVEKLRTCGWRGCDLADLSGLDAEVILVVEAEEYNGKWTSKVKYVNAVGASFANALAGDDLAAFSASMKSKILALDPSKAAQYAAAKPAAKHAQPTRQEPPPPSDDDMPF